MAVLSDQWIREMSKTHRMIEPFSDQRQRTGRISFGSSSYGYDFRLSKEYKIPDLSGAKRLDPKKMEKIRFLDHQGRFCWIPSNSFILGRSLEYFRIPRDVIVICQGKSTYARSGVIVNVTPLEPEWEVYITIALVNSAPIPVKVYSGATAISEKEELALWALQRQRGRKTATFNSGVILQCLNLRHLAGCR